MATEQIPTAVTRLLSARYPTLRINPIWLSQCVGYLRDLPEPIRPVTDDQLAKQVRQQLLAADLGAATLSTTGSFPSDLTSHEQTTIAAGTKNALLVQVVSIMDIGVSAAAQLEVAEARKAARSTLGGPSLLYPAISTVNATAPARALNGGEDNGEQHEADAASHMADFAAQEEEAGRPSTVFPRKMLQLLLSDGHTAEVAAFEHERVQGLDMNETMLGCKILLKGAHVRRGQILLTPKCIVLEGGQVEEWQAEAEDRLINLLRQKLGKAPLEPITNGGTRPDPLPASSATAGTRAAQPRAAAPQAPSPPPPQRQARPAPPSRPQHERTTIDEFDALEDDEDLLLLAAAEMEDLIQQPPTVAAAAAVEAKPPTAIAIRATNGRSANGQTVKREVASSQTTRQVETIVLSESEDEKQVNRSDAAVSRAQMQVQSSRENPIVIESSPEP
ncbi:hypothetical protein ACQY0O_002151 [Thecaphora frezii]